MAEQASDYHHGEQDIQEQQETFHAVMAATKWSIVALAALIAFLALWFCTAAGFFDALLAAVVIVVVGVVFLRRGSSEH
jgi:hypothetical protein